MASGSTRISSFSQGDCHGEGNNQNHIRHPDRAEKVEGTDVYNLDGEKLGTVDDMIDKVSGNAT